MSTTLAKPAASDGLPVVDLGYGLHQALVYNQTQDFYVFSNIRYAQPPVGDLRFRAPLAPHVDRSTIHNGSEPRFCPKGVPAWQALARGPIAKYEQGAPFTLQNWEADIANATIPSGSLNANTSEDCLFMDVVTPAKALARATKNKKDLKNGAAVLVWIHGGGWVLGSKRENADPFTGVAGLMKYGNAENDSGMIFVGINYRLGALGWLAGKAVEEDGVLNAGLLDQRLALQWVQDNIHLFGGDASRVTIMGESAAGGSIILQYTMDPRTRKPLFSQMIAQSPGTMPTFAEAESTYASFLKQLNVTTLAEVRKVSSSAIIAANERLLGSAPPTTYFFNPVFDNKTVPATPKQVFDTQKHLDAIKVLTGVNSFEGSFFYDATVKNEPAFLQTLRSWLPGLSEEKIDYIANSVYPPIFDGSLGYVDWATRQSLAFAEGVIYCNAELLNSHFKGDSYAYEFAVPPGYHIQDLVYTFDDRPIPYPTAKYTLQRTIASFVVNGVPSLYTNGSSQAPIPFPAWDPAKRMTLNITTTGANWVEKQLSRNTTRCQFWQQGVLQ